MKTRTFPRFHFTIIFLMLAGKVIGDQPSIELAENGRKSKIFDCFLFYNELEILEIKLNELYDHVDYFVIVEATETFRGNQKPFYFFENKYRFGKFLDKIIHVPITKRLKTNNPWSREAYQRNQIIKGLTTCQDDDIVIIEDLDEIIRASKLPEILEPLIADRLHFVGCTQILYTYYLNRYGHDGGNVVYWAGSVAAKYAYVKLYSPQAIRNIRSSVHSIPDAGWHFTSMGGPGRVVEKLENFSHSELDTESYKELQRIRQDVDSLKLVEIDETYPAFIYQNIDYFKELGLLDLPTQN